MYRFLFLLLLLYANSYAMLYSDSTECNCDTIIVKDSISLKFEQPIVNGKVNGTVKCFEFGRLYREINYTDNKKNGREVEYHPNMTPSYILMYKNDMLNGKQMWFSQDNQIMMRVDYRSGLKEGDEFFFNEDGKVTEKNSYVNGRNISDSLDAYERYLQDLRNVDGNSFECILTEKFPILDSIYDSYRKEDSLFLLESWELILYADANGKTMYRKPNGETKVIDSSVVHCLNKMLDVVKTIQLPNRTEEYHTTIYFDKTYPRCNFGEPGRTKEGIRKIVMNKIGKLKSFYNSELKRGKDFNGKLTVKLVISSGGSVVRVTVLENKGLPDYFVRLIVNEINNWSFTPILKGTATVVYPFNFSVSSTVSPLSILVGIALGVTLAVLKNSF